MISAALALLLALSLCACEGGKPEPGTTGTTAAEEPGTTAPAGPLSVVSAGKSDYAILYDPTDTRAGTLAKAFQNALMKQCGVMLPLRTVRDEASYPKRILVGDTGLAASNALKQDCAAGACLAAVSAQTLALYAGDFDGYLFLEAYATGDLLSGAAKGEWTLAADFAWRGAGDPSDSVTFQRDGKTTYSLVFPSGDADRWTYAATLAKHLTDTTGVRFKAVADSGTYENEILWGSVDRPQTKRIARYLTGDSYFSGVFDGTYVIASEDLFGLTIGIARLAESVGSMAGSAATVTRAMRALEAITDLPQDAFLENAVLLARRTYGTYGSWIAKRMSAMKQSDKDDIALVRALVDRLAGGIVLSAGSSSALLDGFVVKLDRTDYNRTVTRTASGAILVPSGLIDEFLDVKLPANADGDVNLSAYCAATDAWSLSYDEKTEIVTVMPKGRESFADLAASVGGYTNRAYLDRMEQFFRNTYLPEPDIPTEQTRQEIISTVHDDTYVWDYTQAVYECYASPAILTLKGADGRSVLYTAYDISNMHFPGGVNTMLSCDTVFQKSTDGGKTWERIAFEKGWTYVSLTELDGKILLMGTRTGDGSVTVALYDPANGEYRSAALGFSVMGTAPTAVAIHNGRVWRAHNNAVISAPVGSDLLNGDSWTKSESPNEVMDETYYETKTGLNVTGKFWLEEGNMVVGQDGKLYAVYRIDASPSWGYAAVFEVSENGKTLKLAEHSGCLAPGLIPFPSNQSKFMIKYDGETGRYLSFVSVTTGTSQNQRNVLSLVASRDLFTWETVGVVLVERQMMNELLSEISHAYQYVDFAFDGDDLLLLVREAVGKSCNYHNANAITLYRLTDYASFVRSRLG